MVSKEKKIREVMGNVWTPEEDRILQQESVRYVASLNGNPPILREMSDAGQLLLPDRTRSAVTCRLQAIGIWRSKYQKRKQKKSRKRSRVRTKVRAGVGSLKTQGPKIAGCLTQAFRCPSCGALSEVK